MMAVPHLHMLSLSVEIGSGESLQIDLYDTTNSSVDVNIGEQLVKEGLASLGSPSPAIQNLAIKSLSALGRPKPTATEKVYVTTVESPGCLYCQISSSEEKLSALMSEISAVYESLPANELAVASISVGDVCCAQFSEDNRWYRAVVEENNGSALTVRFIDYGNTETLPVERTKVLKDAFFSEPPLAIKCSLHDVQPFVGQTWTEEASTFFEQLTSEKELDAKFVSLTEPFHIQLSESGTDIGQKLVKTKLAAAQPASPGKSSSEDYPKPVVECGEMYDVCITHISSPGKFYCQLVKLSDQLEGSKS